MSEIKPPTEAEYKREALRLRLSYAPRVYGCMKCGWPVREGFCCNTCGDNNPSEPPSPETKESP